MAQSGITGTTNTAGWASARRELERLLLLPLEDASLRWELLSFSTGVSWAVLVLCQWH